MGKILVLYDSFSGNTREMAELVALGAKENLNMEVSVKSVCVML